MQVNRIALYEQPYVTERGALWNKIYMDVPAGLGNFDFHFTKFCPHLPPISMPNLYKKASNFAQTGCFLPSFAHNTPNLCKLGTFICDETSIAIPKFMKRYPKRQAHILKPCQYEYPPQCNLSQ